MEPKRVSPNDGGCWFCYTQDDNLLFDTEFDTFVHASCIIDELRKVKHDQGYETEAVFMDYLLEPEELESV